MNPTREQVNTLNIAIIKPGGCTVKTPHTVIENAVKIIINNKNEFISNILFLIIGLLRGQHPIYIPYRILSG